MYIPVSLSENQVIGRNVSLLVLLPEAVCCCLQTCNCGFDICVGRNVSLQVLLPEAVCCCLQTCNCGFDISVVLRTSVPSLIVRNANTRKL